MKEIVISTLIAIVVSVVVLFTLGPVMMRMQASTAPAPAPTPGPATVPTAAPPAAAANEAATAPNVEGMLIADARDRWREAGILIIEDGTRVDTMVSPGTIIEQLPSAGAPLKQKEIRAIVARAPELIGLPNVVGDEFEGARERLVQAGFDVPDPKREAADVPGGQVLRQEPPAGEQIEKGSSIRLVIAAELIAVPRLRGTPIDRAKIELTEAGLEVGAISEREDMELSGRRVLSQSPDAGEKVAPGTTVDLVIVAPD